VFAHGVDIQSVLICHHAVAFDDGNDFDLIFQGQIVGSVAGDVAKSLDHGALAGQTVAESGSCDILGIPEEFLQGKVHSLAGRLDAPGYAATFDRFSGDAGILVDVLGKQGLVGVGDPRPR
jgi:hypothetical protein